MVCYQATLLGSVVVALVEFWFLCRYEACYGTVDTYAAGAATSQQTANGLPDLRF